MDVKIVVNDKDGKSYQKVVEGDALLGKSIGDSVDGKDLGLPGYELTVKGGSDKDGFPMRHDLSGVKRKKLMLGKGIGFNPDRKGIKRRKTVCSRTVTEDITQVNCVVSKAGSKKLSELFKKVENEQSETA
jgi:small subunit ribosomal protein S6e